MLRPETDMKLIKTNFLKVDTSRLTAACGQMVFVADTDYLYTDILIRV